jgi:hypothetical protein
MKVFQPGDRVIDNEEYGEVLCLVLVGTETPDVVEHELEVIRTIHKNRFGQSHEPGLRYTHRIPKAGIGSMMIGELLLADEDLT